MHLGLLSLFIWFQDYQMHGKAPGTPLSVDYAKYRSGEADFICHEPHFDQRQNHFCLPS